MNRSQRWDLNNPEKRRAISARYRARNRERRNAEKRAWAKQNRAHLRQYANNYYHAHYTPKQRRPGRSRAQILEIERARDKKQAIELHDIYIRGYLSSRHHIKNPPYVLPQPKDINELRDHLLAAFQWVKEDPRRSNQVKEMANTAGKVLASVKLQMEYAFLKGEEPDIPFLGKTSGKLLKPGAKLLNA